ncbi:uncharacterized protein LOC129601369 isoform X2 [Paramacrobiotus metropolitanus]|uniref:uncharacterized protein LOC129601369 isoform X2 n=1 Tax=Paramacrobiotus metropolitanus TaxID=2943436 RepID=UPI0024458352|nr:uncharacterized protein LOC129601369 isoform X2 [Paramacrobiotus metropolitanus]
MHTDYNTDGFGIADLPHPILVAVFLHLHARVQGRIHRVCMLWHLMLPEHLVTRNVLVDIAVEIYDTLNSLWSDTYSLTMVLDQMITKHTKTLTLADFGGRGEFEIRAHTTLEVLLAKGIKVPMIIIKNCANANGELVKNAVGSGNYECENFSKLMAVCDQLLIVNHEFTVQTFFREPALSVLSVGQPQALPEPEQRFLRPRCDDKDYRVVAINRLILHSAETSDQHVRLFLLAVNNSYPPISHFVYDKVAVIYQRWLQTLVYPEDWAAVRNFLNLFSGFHLDGSLQRWDTLDLRKLNIPALNRLTLAAIDETFKDADNDY